MNFPVRHEETRQSFFSSRRQPVHEQVITDEQGLLHGRGRNLELLNDESQNKQSSDEYSCHSCNEFRPSLFGTLGVFLAYDFVFSVHCQLLFLCAAFYFTRLNVRFHLVWSKKCTIWWNRNPMRSDMFTLSYSSRGVMNDQ